MVILYAPNVHQGGGRVLLEALLESSQGKTVVVADQRFQSNFRKPRVETFVVKPTLIGRLKAEILLRRLSRSAESILCFGNLPPLFRLRGQTTLFFQNANLLKKYLAKFPHSRRTRLRIFVERLWLKWGIKNIDRVIVQSQTVRTDFLMDFPMAKVEIAPFRKPLVRSQDSAKEKIHDFVYVASGDAHKNHSNLIKAWELLAEEGHFPTLALTLSTECTHLLNQVKQAQAKSCKIKNFSGLSHQQVGELYQVSKALIFPSEVESFGLPLLEAQDFGLPILASERDYVRELVQPVESFDPSSPRSIAKAVKRKSGMETSPQLKVNSPEDFLSIWTKGSSSKHSD